MESFGREVCLYGGLARSGEGKSWNILGDWKENRKYLVVDVVTSRKAFKLRLMEKTSYERVRCYPVNIPIYRPFINPECVEVA